MNEMKPIAAQGVDLYATPMMQQYLEIKAAHPDALLFYRMGDFYELFFEDAEKAAPALGIALTRRGKHLGDDIPMCGVPIHAAEDYLQRLIRQGFRVAVCEQVEEPEVARSRGAKAVVKRGIVRLVTPGTLTEDSLLDSGRHNFLAALARLRADGELAVAWADISSGDVSVMASNPGRLASDLARLAPSEIIIPDTLFADEALAGLLKAAGCPLTPLPGSRFDSLAGERRLKEQYAVAALDSFGQFGRAEIAALGGLIDYILLTQVGRAPVLKSPRREEIADSMLIDPATRANLELTRTLAGGGKGSLLAAIDMTMTATGARLLAERLANPLADPDGINARLDEIGYFHDDRSTREAIRRDLKECRDLERALARLSVGRGGPRDVAVIRDGLAAARKLAPNLVHETGLGPPPPGIATIYVELARMPDELTRHLADALGDSLPVFARDGGFIREGHSRELDENRRLRDETRRVIAGLQAAYAEKTGVRSLKIRHNNVIGYYIEVTAQNAAALQTPAHAGTYIHRQTVASAMRFTTIELSGLEQRIAVAAERALAIELDLFAGLVEAVRREAQAISAVAAAVAALDVATALAELAARHNHIRPRVDNSLAFSITNGRHPVVETALAREASGAFIPNSCDLTGDNRHIWLLTGPNMAGKSTFLRQNALIVILAQMGAFVPASHAHIGIVDRLFSRVGAADDIARGRSTFMVEMVETAAILNQATERSFVILDEIGRGTATFDGLSIAWAAVEHLHDVNRCRAIFATHYHELTALAGRLVRLANATVKVREWQGDVVFLHEVAPGVADRSYGIQVAKLAGLPAAVVARATEVLDLLERSEHSASRRALADDLPLFSAARPQAAKSAGARSAVERRLAEILPDELTAREALALIYELKAVADARS